MKPTKILWIDVETTGLDSRKNSITQLSIIYDEHPLIERRNFHIKPLPGSEIDPIALQVQGKTADEIDKYPVIEEVFPQFLDFMDSHIDRYDPGDKAIFGGFNARFDYDFISSWYSRATAILNMPDRNKYGIGVYVRSVFLDPLPILHLAHARGLISLPSYRLQSVCDHLGIPLMAHDSMSDIRATRHLFIRLHEAIPYFRIPAFTRSQYRAENPDLSPDQLCSGSMSAHSVDIDDLRELFSPGARDEH
jgi:DNA polymerase-3 subunit epsilon